MNDKRTTFFSCFFQIEEKIDSEVDDSFYTEDSSEEENTKCDAVNCSEERVNHEEEGNTSSERVNVSSSTCSDIVNTSSEGISVSDEMVNNISSENDLNTSEEGLSSSKGDQQINLMRTKSEPCSGKCSSDSCTLVNVGK